MFAQLVLPKHDKAATRRLGRGAHSVKGIKMHPSAHRVGLAGPSRRARRHRRPGLKACLHLGLGLLRSAGLLNCRRQPGGRPAKSRGSGDKSASSANCEARWGGLYAAASAEAFAAEDCRCRSTYLQGVRSARLGQGCRESKPLQRGRSASQVGVLTVGRSICFRHFVKSSAGARPGYEQCEEIVLTSNGVQLPSPDDGSRLMATGDGFRPCCARRPFC